MRRRRIARRSRSSMGPRLQESPRGAPAVFLPKRRCGLPLFRYASSLVAVQFIQRRLRRRRFAAFRKPSAPQFRRHTWNCKQRLQPDQIGAMCRRVKTIVCWSASRGTAARCGVEAYLRRRRVHNRDQYSLAAKKAGSAISLSDSSPILIPAPEHRMRAMELAATTSNDKGGREWRLRRELPATLPELKGPPRSARAAGGSRRAGPDRRAPTLGPGPETGAARPRAPPADLHNVARSL